MTVRAVRAFENELDVLIARFRAEWDLTYSEAVGVLELAKHKMISEALDDDEDAEEEA